MKKNIILFVYVTFIFIHLFSFFNKYERLFLKPGYYFEYNISNNKQVNFNLFNISKFPVLDSNEILSKAWSQQRSLIGGQIMVESSNYTHAISSSNAMGLLQMKYLTGQDLYVYNLFDPYDNLKGALEYHGYLRLLFDDEKKQIAAYHDGPSKILKNGMTSSGELYYLKVKEQQKKYQNRKIYSPFIYGLSFGYDGLNLDVEKINTSIYLSAAYRKIEFYSDLYINLSKKSDIIKSDFNFEISVLYYPSTVFAFGIENLSGVIRIGLPWEHFILKFYNDPEFSYFKKINDIVDFKAILRNNYSKLGFGFKYKNIQSDLYYEIFSNSFIFEIKLF
ncbi:MAG: hypothetical protein PWP28_1184 [Oceanotoga sp.]|uniref:Transglycosylase-like protein with SLT domain n=1 Tax=Oceanotoga teriensis TaxID=515440 RepID=A0AA45C5F1_9BACT|nr:MULTISPECIES: transglycosylase SLT domain-containing protein [Oceanotoga]MDN5342309.1 hypothetical protein [Oceanotoga sp.]PWJ88762.1 transglycosylase-like protein with SLT domain [Oceanotoga teriensis]